MKKRGLIISIIVLTVLTGGILGYLFMEPDPVELAQHGLEHLNSSTSFRYTISQQQWVEGQERKLTQINGEKDGVNIRVWGTLVGTEIEMIRSETAFYTKDPFTKHWVQFPSVPAYQEVFLAELDPLSSLQFKELGEVMLKGQEKVNGKQTWVITFKPSIQNPIMEQSWNDFNYTLFVRKQDKAIVRAEISAVSKEKGEPVSMVIEFRDFGEPIKIEEPRF